ncbi:MAG: cell division protein FtsA [Candidatus Aminicenantia bacterium]
MGRKDRVVVGLDVGSKKIATSVGRISEQEIEIVGVGAVESSGVLHGSIVDLQATRERIKESVRNAEMMSAIDIDSAWVSISGVNIRSFNSRGMVAVSGKDKEITKRDKERVIEAAKAVSIPPDIEIIQFLPQEFIVDNQPGILEPVGMTGIRLEVNVHIITNSITATSNLIKCVTDSGINIKGIVPSSIASAEAVLTPDEKFLGVAVVDIGAGITDVAIYERGFLWHTFTLPIGGAHFTNDIAIGLRTPIPEAEKIKKKWGASPSTLEEDDNIEVARVGGGPPKIYSKKVLWEIIQSRAEELFKMIYDEIKRMGMDKSLNTGVVITGGTSLLEGILEIAEDVFNLPVRRGTPMGITGLEESVSSPEFSTAVGLLFFERKGIYKTGGEGFLRKLMSRIF